MEQYISKSALLAKIESFKNRFIDRNGHLEDSETNGLTYETLCELEDSIDSLEVKEVQEEPVSEDLKKAADNALESISDQYDIISVGSCLEMFRLGAEWQMNKLPKWRRTPIKGGCWSGEIGVRPTARLFVYEHYSIKADKLFKLLNKED